VIAKITRGSGFRGTLAYTLAPEHRPDIVGGNMAGQDVSSLAREFAAVRQLRPDVEKPVVHVSLSFDPGRADRQGDRQLRREELGRLAEDYLKRMSYDPHRVQWVAIEHRDRPHQHVHLVVSRVRLDGSLVRQEWRDFRRNKDVCQELERDYGLRSVDRTREPLSRAPTRGEDRMLRDRGILSEKLQLKALIREAAQGSPTMTEFLTRLQTCGVQARPNLARTGHVSGVSYRLEHVAVKGSHLGRAYSWEGLQRTFGVRYDPTRDLRAVQRAARLTQGQEPTRRRGLVARELGYGLEKLAGAQLPAVSRGAHVARTGTRLRDLMGTPSAATLAAAAARVVPGLDPRLVAIGKLLGQALAGRDRAQDPPIEREMPISPAGLDQDRDR
jgi:Relaxase/Mobilisation nuclease domain